MIRRRIRWCAAGLILATACTTTYGPDDPPEEAIEKPLCEEGSVGPGCAEVNPDCTDPSSYCAEPL